MFFGCAVFDCRTNRQNSARGSLSQPPRAHEAWNAERPTSEKCAEAYYLQRTRFESIAERKLRRRQLTEDGNVEIRGRDLR